jgi:large conductance mechanosensitive channel
MGLIAEFKEFVIKGNFIDLAVGVIIGAASGAVVKSLVDQLIMPPIGLILGRVNFRELKVILQPEHTSVIDGKPVIDVKEVAIGYGAVIQSFLELLIIGFVVFMVVRLYNKVRNQAPPPGPTPTEVLLTEIRDSLKKSEKAASS